jgi:hypothetical protein
MASPSPVFPSSASGARLVQEVPGERLAFEVPSRSRKDKLLHPVINLHEGTVDCDCEHYDFRLHPTTRKAGREHVSIGEPSLHCYHIERALHECVLAGHIRLDIPQQILETTMAEDTPFPGVTTAPTQNSPFIIHEGFLINTQTGAITEMPEKSVPAHERMSIVKDMLQRGELIKGQDYGDGSGRGGGKPSLLKPGAQRLMSRFQLASEIKTVTRSSDPGEYAVEVVVVLRNKVTGAAEAEGVGYCTSKERRYARQAVPDIANTVLKIAKKRGMVDATLDALGIASIFTQDIEDLDLIEDEAPRRRPAPEVAAPAPAPKPKLDPEAPITPAQIAAIQRLAIKLFGESGFAAQLDEYCKAHFKSDLRDLNQGQAKSCHTSLMKTLEDKATPPADEAPLPEPPAEES